MPPHLHHQITPFQRRERAKLKNAPEGSRSRGWIIVDFVNLQETAMKLDTISCEYYVYQEEYTRAWNRHIQGYVHFKSARSFASMKKKFPKAKLICATGSAEKNKAYCQKEKTRVANGLKGEGGGLDQIACICTMTISLLNYYN